MEKRMTKRQVFEAVTQAEGLDENLRVWFEEELVKMDAANERRKAQNKEKVSKARMENEALADTVYEDFGDEALTATMAAEKFGLKSAQKATAVFKVLVEQGRVNKVAVRVGNTNRVAYEKV